MIFGVFSHSSSGSVSFIPEPHPPEVNSTYSFHPVSGRDFDGGFCLNDRLPYKATEVHYVSREKDITVLMSGTVYNRQELLARNSIPDNVPDAELVAILFSREGPGFVGNLNGDFSIALIRHPGEEIYLFRDHMGIRPMAWSTHNGRLWFSSDIAGLCRILHGDTEIDTDYLSGWFRYIDLKATPCVKVRKLIPGHWLRFDRNGVETVKYWHPERIPTDRKLSYGTMISDLNMILRDAVIIRSDKRFTAGAHVSSGLDSGIIAAIARRAYSHQADFRGFSLSPESFSAEGLEYDERELVRKICALNDINPVFSELVSSDIERYVLNYYSNQGYFTDDKILEQAAALNVNLLFSGWGGDEFISTGSRSIDADLLYGFYWRAFSRRHSLLRPRRLLRVIVKGILYPTLGIMDKNLRASLRDNTRYLARKYRQNDRNVVSNYFFHSSRRKHHLGMISFYHLPERCEAWFVNGWRKGVEYRYPLLDRRIVEYMMRVPSKLLTRTNNYRPLLRELGKDLLPEEVRTNMSKADPVYREFIGKVFEETGFRFRSNVNVWRRNTDLKFIDFDLLKADLAKYEEDRNAVDARRLFRAVVYIRALHEFSILYHSQDNDKPSWVC